MKRLLIPAALLLAGCASLPQVNTGGEIAYQALHAIDTAQTLHGPVEDSTCYAEGDPITRRLIGTHPSRAGVLAWGAGEGVLHYAVHRLLADHAPAWVDTGWQALTLGATADEVGHNISIGVRIGGRNDPPGGDCRPGAQAQTRVPTRR